MRTETTPDPTARRALRRRALSTATLLSVAGLLAAGCGGGSSSPSPKGGAEATGGSVDGAPSVTVARPTTPAPDPHKSVASTDPVTRGHKVARARITGSDETATGGARPLNPCALVTRAEAGAILGRQIAKITNAPQGPTCIYQPRGAAKNSVTLAVEAVDVAVVRKQSRVLSQVKLAGRPAYCVKLGAVKMFVALPGGRALNVTAPCQMAASFATKALARLG
jgi:hypothetical protein